MIYKLLLTLAITALPFADKWTPDTAKAKISFAVKGPFGTVHGNFSGLTATIQFSEKDLAGSSLLASVEVKTISTGIKLRNSDLRDKEVWFNAAKYPKITFKSKKIEKTAKGYKALGDLTLKGTTKSIEIPFTFTVKGSTGVFKSQFEINRQDYHLGKEGGSVGNTVTINLEVPVKK
jgi:polyisoprenoid-binding protein YceI